ncbi:MAG: DUF4020 domain-containing protein [Myxococcales bacterium]|nr:DUF4020 domain-containing protein [Myxococcales bacterium]
MLKTHIQTAVTRLDALGCDRQKFLELYVYILFSIIKEQSESTTWYRELWQHLERDDFADVAASINTYLSDESTGNDAKATLWHRWLHDYWQGRLDGKPVGIGSVEANAIMGWLGDLAVPGVFAEAVTFAESLPESAHTIEAMCNWFPPFEQADPDLLSQFPNEVVRIVLLGLKTYGAQQHDRLKWQEWLKKLHETSIDPTLKTKLYETLIGAGFSPTDIDKWSE